MKYKIDHKLHDAYIHYIWNWNWANLHFGSPPFSDDSPANIEFCSENLTIRWWVTQLNWIWTFHMDSVLEKECDMAWRSDSGFCWCAADLLWVRVFWLPRALIQGKQKYSSAYQWHSLLAHCTLQKKNQDGGTYSCQFLEWSKVIFLAFSLLVVLITFVGILPC